MSEDDQADDAEALRYAADMFRAAREGRHTALWRSDQPKLSRVALRDLSGVSAETIQKFEEAKGWPGVPRLSRLLRALGIDRTEFLDAVDAAVGQK